MLLDLSQGHPHPARQLAFHAFRLARASGEAADEETALAARDEALDEAEPEFRAILHEMSPPRRAAFVALCKEPTDEPYSRPYMRRHGIKSFGALKSGLDGARCVWLPGEEENRHATRADRSSAGPLDPRADERFLGVGP